MANPQRENGHVDIANELIEALAKVNLASSEVQCLWFVFRKTYGWNKKEDEISISQFIEATKLSKRTVIYALQNLEAKNMIKIKRTLGKKNMKATNRISFQKNHASWVVQANAKQYQKVIADRGLAHEKLRTGVVQANVCGASVRKRVVQANAKQYQKVIADRGLAHKKSRAGGVASIYKGVVQANEKTLRTLAHTKDTTTKDILLKEKKVLKEKEKELIFPNCVDRSLIEKYIQNRIDIKKKMTHHAKELFLLKIQKFHDKGEDVKDLIEKAIIAGWSDIYEQKGKDNAKGKNFRGSERKPLEKAESKSGRVDLGPTTYTFED